LDFWKAVRGRSRLFVLAAVFCLFASIGLIALQMSTGRLSTGEIVLYVLFSGGFAVGYFLLLIDRKYWYFAVLIGVQVVLSRLLLKVPGTRENLTGPALHRQHAVLATCAIVAIVAAYSLMIHLFTVEGKRYFQISTEIALASEIHRSLVPACAANVGGFEIYGASVPSGEVGGDLVDVMLSPEEWIGYVADVSGHGVQSGVMMAMFKTALHAQIASGGSVGRMLGAVHRTLFPLKMSNMFVTVEVLRGGTGGRTTFASGGHPPMLHYHKRDGSVSEHGALDAPLGVTAEQEFSESAIQCEVGDVLLILTDGMTEVFDKRGNELGLAPIKEALRKHIDSPLQELFSKLRQVSTGFGTQSDDQTMLLARYRAE